MDSTVAVSSLNMEALEKASKKITRKERRDRKKKKRREIVEESDNSEECNNDNTDDTDNNDNNDNNNSENNVEPKKIPPLVPAKIKSKLGNSGGRVFASNPVLYKHRRKDPSHLTLSQENKDSEKDEKDEKDEITENLKNELLTSIELINISQISTNLQKLKEIIGDNINFRAQDGLTLVHKAILKNSTEIMQILLDNGAVVNVPSLNGLSPLHFAAQLGDLQSVEFLLSKSANPMQRDIENKSCLHFAVIGGNLECVEIVAKQPGVLVNHRDNSGCSSLHYAVKAEYKDIVDYLLNKGADPLLMDQNGNRPIDYLPGFSRFISPKNYKLSHQGKKVLKLLKKKGGHRLPIVNHKSEAMGGGLANSRSKSLDHRNPAISTDFAKNLQSKGMNLNISCSNGLQSAPSEKKPEVVQEKDLELLYYNPTPRPEDHQAPVTTTPLKKTDKYGFYTNLDSSSFHSKPSKILKEEKLALKWLEFMKNWEEMKSKTKKIQKYCDRGIPDSVRGMAWKLVSGCVSEENVVYEELLQRDSIPKVKEQILKDITRTMPNHILFQEKGQGQQMLTNVLTAYSVYKPNVGYCQGMGFITAMFLMYMPEEDAFWMLNRIADEYRFARLWDEHMGLVTECMFALGVLMQQNLPDVQTKLEEDNIPPISYVPQFFITGFLYSLPFPMVVRIWDCFLLRKFDYLYAVAIALFKVTKEKVLKMRMEEMMIFLKFKDSGEELDFTVDQLLKTSMGIWAKLAPNQIRKLEEEGARVRAAEKERMLNERI